MAVHIKKKTPIFKNPEISMMPISIIKPYWRNPRINDDTIPALKATIKRHGFQVPLVVDKESVLVTGHARYKALQELGFEEVPVIVSNLSNKEHRKFRLLDNKVAEKSKWDEQALEEELKSIFEGTDFGLAFGKSLNSVLNLDGLLTYESPNLGEGEKDAPTASQEAPKGDPPEPYEVKCPYCDAELSTDNIVGEEKVQVGTLEDQL
jgi:ParB-like chromosome segregation protein Spo0J